MIRAAAELDCLFICYRVRRGIWLGFTAGRPNVFTQLIFGLENFIAYLTVQRHLVDSRNVLFDIAHLRQLMTSTLWMLGGIVFKERAGKVHQLRAWPLSWARQIEVRGHDVRLGLKPRRWV